MSCTKCLFHWLFSSFLCGCVNCETKSTVYILYLDALLHWLTLLFQNRCRYLKTSDVLLMYPSCFSETFCYTEQVVVILRVVVAICCAGIVFSMFACLLDLCGTMNKLLQCIKNNSVANVLTGTISYYNSQFLSCLLPLFQSKQGKAKLVLVRSLSYGN